MVSTEAADDLLQALAVEFDPFFLALCFGFEGFEASDVKVAFWDSLMDVGIGMVVRVQLNPIASRGGGASFFG